MNQNSGFLNNIPVVTRNLLIINLLFFLADLLLSNNGIMTRYLALHFVYSDQFMPHQIITYMFMHATRDMHGGIVFSHIFFNMFALFMFGRTLEAVWGPKRFLSFYLLTGIGAAALQLLISYIRYTSLLAELPPEVVPAILEKLQTGVGFTTTELGYFDTIKSLYSIVNVPMVGASGAIFGILAGFGMLFPNSELFIIPFPFPIKAKYFVIGYGILELSLGFADRAGDNVAHFAHLGGLIAGLIMLMYWKKKGTLHGKLF